MPFCSRCGKEFPSGATFCMYCGTPITAPIPSPSTVPFTPTKPSRTKRNIVIAGILLLLIIIIAGSVSQPRPETAMQTPQAETGTPPEQTARPGVQVVILDYNLSMGNVELDRINLGSIVLRLRNQGDQSVTISELTISSKTDSVKYETYTMLKPREEKTITFKWPSGKLGKDIGIKQVNLTMRLFGYFGDGLSGSTKSDKQILADKTITIQIPKLRIGDTIPEITEYGAKKNLSLTLLWWKESNIAVKEWSENYYYTFTAKPGMKFVILAYRFKNNWIRVQTTPYLNSGEIATDKGYIYSVWTAPGGLSSKEYKPRTATIDEIRDLMGKSGAFKQLLPGESTEGCVIYEIPADTNPIEAALVYVPYPIEYKRAP